MTTAEQRDQSALAEDEQDDPKLTGAAGEDRGGAPADEEGPDDIDRLLSDPDYFEKANAALGAKARTTDEPSAADAAGTKEGEGAPAAGAPEPDKKAAAPGAEDPDPVVEVITFRGNLIPVRKSESKGLLQKGKSLEVTLEQLRPLRVIAEDAELLGLAHRIQRLPKGKDALRAALRSAFESALPEIEGYTKEDVRDSHRLLRPLLEAEGVLPPAGSAPEGQPPAAEDGAGAAAPLEGYERVRVEDNLRMALEGEPTREDAIATLEFVNQAILKADYAAARGELKDPAGNPISLEAWQQIRNAINDPKHPENFRRFFRQMGEERRRNAAPAPVRLKAGSLPAGGNKDRLGAGAAGAAGREPTKRITAWDYSDEEFEKTLQSL